jgi:hypothetical protein
LYVPVFRTVAGDDDALLGTVVADFSYTIGIIAVDDTFRAGEIWKGREYEKEEGSE